MAALSVPRSTLGDKALQLVEREQMAAFRSCTARMQLSSCNGGTDPRRAESEVDGGLSGREQARQRLDAHDAHRFAVDAAVPDATCPGGTISGICNGGVLPVAAAVAVASGTMERSRAITTSSTWSTSTRGGSAWGTESGTPGGGESAA